MPNMSFTTELWPSSTGCLTKCVFTGWATKNVGNRMRQYGTEHSVMCLICSTVENGLS